VALLSDKIWTAIRQAEDAGGEDAEAHAAKLAAIATESGDFSHAEIWIEAASAIRALHAINHLSPDRP
jgi:hypothetical protein